MLSSIRISAIDAHNGWDGLRSRYFFSHMMSMASFLAWMSSSLMPPFLKFSLVCLRVIWARSPPQMKELISFCMVDSMSFGIPWTVVIYWEMLPVNIWTIRHFAIRVGWHLPHLLKVILFYLMFLDQIACSSMPFPIQPPKIQVGSWSLAMWMLGSSGALLGEFCLVLINWSL